MNFSRFLGVLAMLTPLFVAGCNTQPVPTAEEQADKEIVGQRSALGRSVGKATDLDTDSNISQINTALNLFKTDNDGKAPATLEEAKAAAKVPEAMWTDKTTGKPLVYDPATGTVSK